MFAAKSNNLLQQLANEKLRAFVKPLNDLNFKINPIKTSVLFFIYKNDVYESIIKINDHNIKMQPDANYIQINNQKHHRLRCTNLRQRNKKSI